MESVNKVKRNIVIDLLRGTVVALMIITHVNGLFLQGSPKPLDLFSYLGATVCFTVFLFCSATTYGFKFSHNSFDRGKMIKRIIKTLLTYYILSLYILFITNGFKLGIEPVLNIIFFQQFPPFVEFIFAFVLFDIVMLFILPLLIKFKPRVKSTASVVFAIIIITVTLFAISTHLGREVLTPIKTGLYEGSSSNNISLLLAKTAVTLKVIFIGDPSFHSFPLFAYSPIFLFGFIWGSKSTKLHPKSELPTTLQSGFQVRRYELNISLIIIFLSTLTYTAFKWTDLSVWERWPPSSYFLIFGIIYISLVIFFINLIEVATPNSRLLEIPKQYLAFLSQNTLNFYILHIIILFPLTKVITLNSLDQISSFTLYLLLMLTISFSIRFIQITRNREKE